MRTATPPRRVGPAERGALRGELGSPARVARLIYAARVRPGHDASSDLRLNGSLDHLPCVVDERGRVRAVLRVCVGLDSGVPLPAHVDLSGDQVDVIEFECVELRRPEGGQAAETQVGRKARWRQQSSLLVEQVASPLIEPPYPTPP